MDDQKLSPDEPEAEPFDEEQEGWDGEEEIDEAAYEEQERQRIEALKQAREREEQERIARNLERLEVLAAYLPGVWEASHDVREGRYATTIYFRLTCEQHLLYTGFVIDVRLGHEVTFSLATPKIIVDGKPTPAPAHVFGLSRLPAHEVRRAVFNAGRYAVCADAVLRLCERSVGLQAELKAMAPDLGAQATRRVHVLKAMRKLIGAEEREVAFTEADVITDKVRLRLDDEFRVDLQLEDLDAETALDLLRRYSRKKATA